MYQRITKEFLFKVYKKREKWAHKGQFGRLVAICGSYRYTGSSIFVGLAAYRAGCDLVFLIGPKRAMDTAASYSPLLITEPINCEYLEPKFAEKVLDFINEVKATSVVIGNGLGKREETKSAVLKIIKEINLPMVIDADAISAIPLDKSSIYKKQVIITPHDKEFFYLTNKKITRENLEERIKVAREEACKINCNDGNLECPLNPPITLLVKGNIDIITNGKLTFLNHTGSPKMTVGGTGDTLAGICGAFLARGSNSLDAACAAAFLNGEAGQIASEQFSESMTPLELIEKISYVLKNNLII